MDALQALQIACDAAYAYQTLEAKFSKVPGYLQPMEGFCLYWLGKNWPVHGANLEVGSFKVSWFNGKWNF